MAHPKRKTSNQRKAKRRTHDKAEMPTIVETKNAQGEPFRLNHNASPDGYYKGRRLPGYKDKS